MTAERWLATVLFTDVVGSTAHAARLGDRAWRDLLERHHGAVRGELARFGGREVGTAGDGFVAAFDRPEEAVRCSLEVRRAVAALGLEVRAGLHAGEVQTVAESLGGIAVHIGARIAALAAPGEILASGTVRDLVAGSGLEFRDRGSHPLRGVPGEWRVFAVVDTSEAATRPAAAAAAAEPPGRGRRRGLVAGGVLAVALAAVAAVWLLHGRGPEPTGAASPLAVAVLPFAVRAGPDLAYLSEGMVNLLSTKLDGAGTLRSVDPRAVVGAAGGGSGEGVTAPEQGRAIAERLGAGLFLLGTVLQAGDRLHLDATLYGGRGSETVAEASVEGDADRLFELVDELVSELLRERFRGPAARLSRISALTTHSLPALKAYLVGESALRSGHYRDAMASFETAVAEDSTFALAWYRLSVTADWTSAPQEIRRGAAEQAVRFGRRLSAHDRQLLDAFLSYRRGAGTEAEGHLRAILATYPEDVDAWYQLGENIFHYRPDLGGSLSESREAWERVLKVQPDDVLSLTHLARVAAAERRTAELDSLVARTVRVGAGGDRILEMEALRAWAGDDGADQARVEALLREADDVVRFISIWDAAVFAGNLEGAGRIARVLAATSPAPRGRAIGLALQATLEVAAGRPRAAAGMLVEAERLDEAIALQHRGLLAVMPFLEEPPESLESVRERLRRWDPSTVAPSGLGSMWFTAEDDVHVPIGRYVVGLLDARVGDANAVRGSIRELEAWTGTPEGRTLAANLARGLNAELALRGGRPDAALEALERIDPVVPYILQLSSPFYVQGRERFLKARLLEEAGRLADALLWYGSFDEHSVYDLAYVAPGRLARARLLERMDRTGEAAADYAAVVEAWRDCEPALRPGWEEARRGLERTGPVSRSTRPPGG
jgi:class 3 adenylate cyclase/tetratricopeptide (TPR) repeat protein